MPAQLPRPLTKRPLFGGAISAYIPDRFDDVSVIRSLPDNQEVFSKPESDQSIMIDLLEQVNTIDAASASVYHFNTIAAENGSLESQVVETRVLTGTEIPVGVRDGDVVASVTYGKMRVSKFKDDPQLANLIDVYVACFRLRRVQTDVLVIFNDPVIITPGSFSDKVGSQVQNQTASIAERSTLFNQIVASFTINNYSLFLPS